MIEADGTGKRDMDLFAQERERWQAVLARDAAAGERFVHAVRSSGIYCRPSCPARRPKRRQVRFFATAEEAEAAGFCPATFYARSDAALGMPPSAHRRGGEGQRIRYALRRTKLGWLLLAATDRGVCTVAFGDDPEALEEDLRRRFARAERIEKDAGLESWLARITAFLEDPTTPLDLPLDIRGTAFREKVWRALREIPPGQTVDYGELAKRIGAPRAVRAVGAACGANPTALLIPCHRVRRRDGGLGGWRWGVERKRRLLEAEARLRKKGEE